MSGVQIDRNDLIANAMRSAQFEHEYQIGKLGGPIRRWEWGMTPMTINAYANPTMVEIVFPAAILQPPFFDPNADDAVNYGGIGAVIGHELSHHFDDQGAKYDSKGQLIDWWTPGDTKAFTARLDKLVEQYNQYEPLPGMHVNGRLTLGENTADLAGLTVAHDAYIASLGGKEPPVVDGKTAASSQTEAELVKAIREAGREPVQRDTFYAEVKGIKERAGRGMTNVQALMTKEGPISK